MVHEMYRYSEGTVLSFHRAHWQGRETDCSLPSSADIVNVWSYNPTDSNQNKLSNHWSESIGKFWIRNFFNFPINLYFINIFISQNFKFPLYINLSLYNLCKKWHRQFLTNFIPHGVTLIRIKLYV
jgi:hypothetical protein